MYFHRIYWYYQRVKDPLLENVGNLSHRNLIGFINKDPLVVVIPPTISTTTEAIIVARSTIGAITMPTFTSILGFSDIPYYWG